MICPTIEGSIAYMFHRIANCEFGQNFTIHSTLLWGMCYGWIHLMSWSSKVRKRGNTWRMGEESWLVMTLVVDLGLLGSAATVVEHERVL
jgi:hypothetical protein